MSIFILFLNNHYVLSQTYCTSGVGPTTSLDSNLGAVNLPGEGSTITDASDCPGVQGVRDLTSTQTADLRPGKSYTLTFTKTTCGGTYPTLAGAWIDFNGDKTFGTNEALAPFSSLAGPIVMTFTVPMPENKTIPVVVGTTRLRIQVQETYQTFIDPCANFGYGGTKDFGINILAPGGSSLLRNRVSGGTIFLILLLIGVFLYILIGCVFNKYKRGTTGLKETCPQNEFWWGFCGYVRDGCLFTKAKVFRKKDDIAVYDQIDSNDI